MTIIYTQSPAAVMESAARMESDVLETARSMIARSFAARMLEHSPARRAVEAAAVALITARRAVSIVRALRRQGRVVDFANALRADLRAARIEWAAAASILTRYERQLIMA